MIICARSPPLSKEFDDKITEKRKNQGNDHVGNGNNVFNRPKQTIFLSQPRMIEFTHQQIRVKKKDDKTDFKDKFPTIVQIFPWGFVFLIASHV